MNIESKILLAVAFVCSVPAFGQSDRSIVRMDMKDRSGDGLHETLSVYIEIATVQPDAEQGIVFTLNIENNGSQIIQMLDPVDRFSVSLSSLRLGGTVSLERTRSDSSICKIYTFSDEQLKEMHDNKMARRPFQAFDSEDALRHRHMKTVSDITPLKLDRNTRRGRGKAPQSNSEQFQSIPSGKLTLEAGEHFQAVIQITRIITNPVAHVTTWTGDPITVSTRRKYSPQIIDITSDTYSLRVSLVITTGTDIKHSWGISSDRITIQLGEENNEGQ